jgi:hypothetical protein
MIKPSPWYIKLSQNWRGRPRKFVVEEHMGSKVRTGNAVMIDNGPQGVLWVRGAFNRKDKSIPSPYFKVLKIYINLENLTLNKTKIFVLNDNKIIDKNQLIFYSS